MSTAVEIELKNLLNLLNEVRADVKEIRKVDALIAAHQERLDQGAKMFEQLREGVGRRVDEATCLARQAVKETKYSTLKEEVSQKVDCRVLKAYLIGAAFGGGLSGGAIGAAVVKFVLGAKGILP
jgi:hypothetical protein